MPARSSPRSLAECQDTLYDLPALCRSFIRGLVSESEQVDVVEMTDVL